MKPVKYVTATCACGASFQREVKRGRPQVWCATCQEVPYEQRAAKPVAAPVAEAVEGEPEVEKPKRPFDAYGYCRDEIEAEVAMVYAGYHAWVAEVQAAAKAEGRSLFSIDYDAYGLGDALKGVYAGYKSVKADGFQDQEGQ